MIIAWLIALAIYIPTCSVASAAIDASAAVEVKL